MFSAAKLHNFPNSGIFRRSEMRTDRHLMSSFVLFTIVIYYYIQLRNNFKLYYPETCCLPL